MSRRNIVKKRYPNPDSVYNNYLVSLLTSRILKQGKKRLAEKIISDAFGIIKERTSDSPIKIFETAVKNTTPLVEVKARRVGGSTYQVPLEVSRYRGTTLALRWIIKAAKERSGRTIIIKLANEIIDAANTIGNAVKKREETHKMAEANKAFSQFRFR